MGKNSTPNSISSWGERGFLSWLLPKITTAQTKKFHVPPGDDAAVLRAPNNLVLSIDGITEGTHFLSSWSSRINQSADFKFGQALGWKLLGGSLSDLAAMGHVEDRWVMIYAGVPSNTEKQFLKDFYLGVSESCDKMNATLVGGDTVKANELSLVAAVGGTLKGRALTRRGASVGDFVCLTGDVGDASIGLEWLLKKRQLKRSQLSHFLKKFFMHKPLFQEGQLLAKNSAVTSCLDVLTH